MSKVKTIAAAMSSLLFFAASGAALAEIPVVGEAKPWQLGFQVAVTDVMKETAWFHDVILLPLAIGISVVVALLMLWVFVRYRVGANPVPSKNAHNTLVEVVWTVVPTIIVAIIGIISVRLVYFQDAPPEDLAAYSGIAPAGEEVVLKATGNRWYWEYEYPEEEVSFSSIIVDDADLKPGQPRLLTVDNHVVIPVNTVVRLQVTANPQDVIHAWTIPAFGVKIDAVPGRLNERWFRVLPGFEGRYYGQCSELCGQRHAYMPITVDVVSAEEYQAWLATTKAASNGTPANQTTLALDTGAAE